MGRDELYQNAATEFGRALDRLAAGYEADPETRRDLRQEIHFQIWRSLESFDSRCSLRTWTFRVAHNTAVSWVGRERRSNVRMVSLEEMDQAAPDADRDAAIDRTRALQHLTALIQKLKPLDRQIMLLYLEDMDGAAIAEITGLSQANVSTKLYRIRNLLAKSFFEEQHHAG